MTGEIQGSDIRNVWQSQQPEGGQMSLRDIRGKAGTFYRRIWRRNFLEYVGIVLVILMVGFNFTQLPSLAVQIGSVLEIAGVLYVGYQLHKRASARTLPDECDFDCCVDFHRKELEHQRDALRSVWWWYLGPMMPGIAVVIIGGAFSRKPQGMPQWIGLAVALAIWILVFIGVGKLNGLAAKQLQKQIDELNDMTA